MVCSIENCPQNTLGECELSNLKPGDKRLNFVSIVDASKTYDANYPQRCWHRRFKLRGNKQ